jgi:hypothetical protein
MLRKQKPSDKRNRSYSKNVKQPNEHSLTFDNINLSFVTLMLSIYISVGIQNYNFTCGFIWV